MLGNSLVAEQLTASQEGLSCIELISSHECQVGALTCILQLILNFENIIMKLEERKL
jgi:hypothetical protein